MQPNSHELAFPVSCIRMPMNGSHWNDICSVNKNLDFSIILLFRKPYDYSYILKRIFFNILLKGYFQKPEKI